MKRLFFLSLLGLLLSCSKSSTEPDDKEPEFVMKAGYTYYKITNTTTDTIDLAMIRNTGQNADIIVFNNRLLYPNEQILQELSTTNNRAVKFSYGYCYLPKSVGYGSGSQGLYDVVDRRMLEIKIIKCP